MILEWHCQYLLSNDSVPAAFGDNKLATAAAIGGITVIELGSPPAPQPAAPSPRPPE